MILNKVKCTVEGSWLSPLPFAKTQFDPHCSRPKERVSNVRDFFIFDLPKTSRQV